MRIRHATPDDGAACAAIYAPYVTETVVSFEDAPPTAAEMSERIACSHAWLVAEQGDGVVGFVYGATWMARAAYRWTCVVSIYLAPGRHRAGLGRALYGELFAELGERGYVMAVAGTTLPNDASVGLHRAMGFEEVGTYRAVGWKHGAWHDVVWMQRRLPQRPGSAGRVPSGRAGAM